MTVMENRMIKQQFLIFTLAIMAISNSSMAGTQTTEEIYRYIQQGKVKCLKYADFIPHGDTDNSPCELHIGIKNTNNTETYFSSEGDISSAGFDSDPAAGVLTLINYIFLPIILPYNIVVNNFNCDDLRKVYNASLLLPKCKSTEEDRIDGEHL
jgi:hypothetical protein